MYDIYQHTDFDNSLFSGNWTIQLALGAVARNKEFSGLAFKLSDFCCFFHVFVQGSIIYLSATIDSAEWPSVLTQGHCLVFDQQGRRPVSDEKGHIRSSSAITRFDAVRWRFDGWALHHNARLVPDGGERIARQCCPRLVDYARPCRTQRTIQLRF